MAPTTPKANSKLPKPPSAGGPVPLTGIPAPGSVLQRRTFNSVPGASSVSKTLKDMTPEQQALLAEAISMHSPGLIDPTRKIPGNGTTTSSTATTPSLAFSNSFNSNNSSNTSLGGMVASAPPATALGFSPLQHPSSPSNNSYNNNNYYSSHTTADRSSPTGLASPLSYRPSSTPSSSSQQQQQQQQLGRRPSSSHLRMQDSTNPSPNQNNNNTMSSQPSTTRPSSYSGMSPLSTSIPNLPMTSSSPSPTTPVGPSGLTRPVAGSPSGSRPALTGSRLSAGSVGSGASLGGMAPGGSRSGLLKQPLFQRPTGTTGIATPTTTGLSLPSAGGSANNVTRNLLSAIPGTAALVPPSLDNYEIGDRVIVESMSLSGYLRFVGPTEFKSGTWAGIELDTPTGKNDGSVGG
ncbi:CAP-Gly domain-containing linker protein 4 [Gryganskiella cystojenkinii]|nr:CAP-Gly domain-containing linker protein 4 [Gryganskiella cystojenkinii]